MARPKEFQVEVALERAMEAFWEHGYEATSLSQLTSKMGIQKASLYDTFGDKRQLFLTALGHYHEAALAKITELFQTSPSALEAVETMLMSAVPNGECCAAHKGCLTVNATVELVPHDQEITCRLRQNGAAILDIISEAIALAQARGEIRRDIAPRVAAELISTNFFGITVMGRLCPDPDRLRPMVQMMVACLKPCAER
jgi:TetR/AcrR family transcriptional repressor of nem operon